MGDSDLAKAKVEKALAEARIHVARLERALERLERRYAFPFDEKEFSRLLEDEDAVTLADQVIYRFAKAQDVMGAKLFRAFMQYQQEEVLRPFRDILGDLEKMHVLTVDTWSDLRNIRNKIAHDYAADGDVAQEAINSIYLHRSALRAVIENIGKAIA